MSRRRRLLWGAVAVAAVLAGVSASDANGFRRYFRLSRDAEQLRQRNRELAQQNRALFEEIQALRAGGEALERAAREELGYVRPNELVLQLE